MTRVVGAVLALTLGGTLLQDWRAPALASFDLAWQTIADTYFDPAFGGVDWPAVRRDLRPRVEEARTADEARAVLRDMVGRLGQSHFAILSSADADDALPGSASAPIDIRMLSETEAVVTRVAAAGDAGGPDRVRAGDLLQAIDGQRVADLVQGVSGRDARARQLAAWRRVSRALYGAAGSIVELTVRRVDGSTGAARIPRTEPDGDVVRFGNLPPLTVRVDVAERATPAGRRVGLLAFNIWMTPVDAAFARAVDRFRTAAGIVIDLRGNPGGLAGMNAGIAGHFFAEPVTLGTMRMRATTLTFAANPRLVTTDGTRVAPFGGPVAILVDELSASASETFAGALQGLGRARVFGRQTMGQALPASTRSLPSGDVLLHAIGDFVTASGRRLEGSGVVPDEVVPLRREALAARRDEVVEAALAWLDRPVAFGPPFLLSSSDLQDRSSYPRVSRARVESDPSKSAPDIR
jgi:carboxyl-terminal processing protease